MSGPLAGIRIVEIAALGPAPFAGMMLADHGAEVICIQRPGASWRRTDILNRSRRSIVLDLKQPAALDAARRIIASSDGFIEGFRPGVMERLGLGPDELLRRTPRLVYGRMTGWGQTGSYSQSAGHDINYISVSGALHAFGRAGDKPTPPINVAGDFGGGGMMLAFSMVSALLHARFTGQGQVIDCAMTEGSALLMSMIWGFRAAGEWSDARGVNLLDTGAHFYDTYETRDGRFISLGAIEPQFYRQLRELLGLVDPAFDEQNDRARWPELKVKLAAVIARKTRDEWCALLEGTDTCFAPVMGIDEAPTHKHMQERQAFVSVDGIMQPAPAPRYSVTCNDLPRPPPAPGTDTDDILRECGYDEAELADLRRAGAVA